MRFSGSTFPKQTALFHSFTVLLGCTIGIAASTSIARAQITTANYTYSGSSNIPDPSTYITPDSSGITDTLNITNAGVVTNFNFITITGLAHSYMGDLTATLTHAGVTVDLFDHIGGTSIDYNNDPGSGFVLSSSSTYSFAFTGANYSAFGYHPGIGSTGGTWDTVTTGTYAASGNATGGADAANAGNTLQMFNGTALTGAWTLNIYDNDPLNTGSLTGFILNVSSATPEPTAILYSTLGLAAVLSSSSRKLMRRRRYKQDRRA